MPEFSKQVQSVKDLLRAKVFRAELPAGSRINEDDLRRETGATVRVVRTALRDLTRDGLLTRKRRQGTCVTQRLPANVAATLPSLTSVAILSAMPKSAFQAHGFGSAVLHGIKQALGASARVQILAHDRTSRRGLDELPVVRAEHLLDSVQGLIGIEANNAQVLNDLVRAGLAVVATDFWHPQAVFDVMAVDHESAGYQATAHLLSLGHRKIAFVGEAAQRGSSDPSWQARLSGYLLAMAEVTREPFARWVLDMRRDTRRIKDLLPVFHREVQPTAYVLASGDHFQALVDSLGALSLRCPQDFSVSAADSAVVAKDAWNLSCARVEYDQLGQSALRLLAARTACRALPPVRSHLEPVFRPGNTARPVESR